MILGQFDRDGDAAYKICQQRQAEIGLLFTKQPFNAGNTTDLVMK